MEGKMMEIGDEEARQMRTIGGMPRERYKLLELQSIIYH